MPLILLEDFPWKLFEWWDCDWESIRMRSVVIQFVVFKDIHAAVRMVEQVVGVAAHNQSSSHGVGMGSHDQGWSHKSFTEFQDLDIRFAKIDTDLVWRFNMVFSDPLTKLLLKFFNLLRRMPESALIIRTGGIVSAPDCRNVHHFRSFLDVEKEKLNIMV